MLLASKERITITYNKYVKTSAVSDNASPKETQFHHPEVM